MFTVLQFPRLVLVLNWVYSTLPVERLAHTTWRIPLPPTAPCGLRRFWPFTPHCWLNLKELSAPHQVSLFMLTTELKSAPVKSLKTVQTSLASAFITWGQSVTMPALQTCQEVEQVEGHGFTLRIH